MRTIDSSEDYVEPVYEILHDIFLPTIFGQFPEELKELFTFISPGQGGLGIASLKAAESPLQYAASTSLTSAFVNYINVVL